MHFDEEEWFTALPDDEAGRLIKALFAYEKRGEIPDEFTPSEVDKKVMAFNYIKHYLDRANKAYKGEWE